jgi:transposase
MNSCSEASEVHREEASGMDVARFSDEQWARIWWLLRSHRGIYVRQEEPTRRFVEAVLWLTRAGAPWRFLPAEHGRWNSVYQRFARWQEKGVWRMLLEALAEDADLEWLMLDSTVVRAHACAAGAKKGKVLKPLAAHGADSPASCTPLPTGSATPCASP